MKGDIPTPALTRILMQAVETHQPPLVRGRRVRLRYAHLGGRNPLQVIVHGKQVDELPGSYKKFLAATFRNAFELMGVPLLVRFRNDDNPYRPEAS